MAAPNPGKNDILKCITIDIRQEFGITKFSGKYLISILAGLC